MGGRLVDQISPAGAGAEPIIVAAATVSTATSPNTAAPTPAEAPATRFIVRPRC